MAQQTKTNAQEDLEAAAAKSRDLRREEQLVGTDIFLARHPEIKTDREIARQKGASFEVHDKSYLYRRIYEEIGCTDSDLTVRLTFSNHDGGSQSADMPVFTMAEDGGIDILVYDLAGNIIEHTKQEPTKTEQQSSLPLLQKYIVHRYSPEWLAQWSEEHKGLKDEEHQKYEFPSKKKTGDCGTFPWFPPLLMKAYQEGTKIPTLVLTEGYFKSFCGSLHGIDVVGLGSITLFEEKRNAQLYPDIIRLIKKCEVENVVILYDGDALNIGKNAINELKQGNTPELTTRPRVFASSLDKTRKLIQKNFDKVGVYFAFVNSDNLQGNPKGLDDLLTSKYYSNITAEIVEELKDVSAPSIYFQKYNIRSNNSVDRYFFINNVRSFYEHHAELIGESKFKYFGTIYKYDNVQKEPIKFGTYDINDVVRIDGKFYLQTRIPSFKDMEGRITLKPICRQDIIDDYGSNAPRELVKRKYIAFVNIPSHEHFQQVVGNCWNKYSRLTYEPESDGSWEHIDMLLQHLFGNVEVPGGKTQSFYDLILDYLTIMWKHPEHALPIVCLVSREGGTGKTTFLKLLEAMFEENAAVDLSDTELSAQFNTTTSGKLVIGIDETAVGDNKRITETLKRIATSDTTYTEAKGQDKVKEDSFSKIVLCSNNETHFAHIKPDEERFMIIKVPVLTQEQKKANPDIKKFLKDEVPAFVGFLNQRGIRRKCENRLWFNWSEYHTKAFDDLQEVQLPKNMRVIRDMVRPIFLEHHMTELLYDVRFIEYELRDKFDKGTDVRKLLEEQWGLEKWNHGARTSKQIKFWHIDNTGAIHEGPTSVDTSDNYQRYCRPYVFPAKKFLNDEEYESLVKYNDDIASANSGHSQPTQQQLPLQDKPDVNDPKFDPLMGDQSETLIF